VKRSHKASAGVRLGDFTKLGAARGTGAECEGALIAREVPCYVPKALTSMASLF